MIRLLPLVVSTVVLALLITTVDISFHLRRMTRPWTGLRDIWRDRRLFLESQAQRSLECLALLFARRLSSILCPVGLDDYSMRA